jgi:membrane protease YdiL (CAAX protease family)
MAIAICALLAYQIAEMLFMLPIRGHFSNPTVSSLILMLIGFTVLIWWLRRTYLRFTNSATPPDHHGWRWQGADFKRLMRGLVIGLVLLAAVQVLSSILVAHQVIQQSTNEVALDRLISRAQLTMTVFTVVAAPLTEELIFRGLLMNLTPLPRTKAVQAFNIFMSAGCFAIVHGPTTLIDVFIYAGMGAALALTYAITRDLKCSIALHILNNLLAALI